MRLFFAEIEETFSMKKRLLLVLLVLNVFHLFAQVRNPIPSGEITIVTNQTMKFKNLRFVDNQVVFINIETQSEFTYFLNSVRSIDDAEGVNLYLKEGEVFPKVKPGPKVEWYENNLPLRKDKKVYAQIIFKNGDTLKTYIKVAIPFYESDGLSEVSLNTKVTAIINGEKVKFRAEQIESLRLVDFYFRDRKFILMGKVLVEVLFDGKIKWYKNYYKRTNDQIEAFDLFLNEDTGQFVSLGLFNNRKKLKEITITRADLVPFIESMDVDDKNIMKLLEKFEE